MDSQSTEERAEKVIIALTPEQLKDICANAVSYTHLLWILQELSRKLAL